MNWSSASGVPLAFAVIPVPSASALTLTLPIGPRRSVLTLDEDSEILTEDTFKTKLAADESVFILVS